MAKNNVFTGTARPIDSVGHATHGRRFPVRLSAGPQVVTTRRLTAGEMRELQRFTRPAFTSPFRDEDEGTASRRREMADGYGVRRAGRGKGK